MISTRDCANGRGLTMATREGDLEQPDSPTGHYSSKSFLNSIWMAEVFPKPANRVLPSAENVRD